MATTRIARETKGTLLGLWRSSHGWTIEGSSYVSHSAAEGILFNILPVDYKNQLNGAIKTQGATPLFEFKKNLLFP